MADYPSVLMGQLSTGLGREKRMGYTLCGPHMDDFHIFLNEQSLYSFYSRGINRICAVLLHLAERVVLGGLRGQAPILLLDDALCELDWTNKQRLAGLLSHHSKVVYTGVLEEDQALFPEGTYYSLKQGVLSTLSGS